MSDLMLPKRPLIREYLLTILNRTHIHLLPAPLLRQTAGHQRLHHLLTFSTVVLIILRLLHEHHF